VGQTPHIEAIKCQTIHPKKVKQVIVVRFTRNERGIEVFVLNCKSILLLCWCLWTLSCARIDIFDSSETEVFPIAPESSQESILTVTIAGPTDEPDQRLRIYADGTAYLENYQNFSQKIAVLTQADIEHLQKTFSDNDFFNILEPAGIDRTFDSYAYRIDYSWQDENRTLTLGPENSSSNSDNIVAEIDDIIHRLADNGLDLRLIVEKQSGTFIFTLDVLNSGKQPLTLSFNSMKTHDIIVRDPSRNGPEATVWNWAKDFVFAQVAQQHILAVGQTLRYKHVWDGRDNQGTEVKGTFAVSGHLLSTPGGITRALPIFIE
jgi:hypothetical protein